jgi:hypothetical protein
MSHLKCSGEPHPVKVGREVRRGPVGKVLLDRNSLAGYPTQCAVSRCHELPLKRAEGSYQYPSNVSLYPEMRGNPKGTHSRREKRREKKEGLQDAFANVG